MYLILPNTGRSLQPWSWTPHIDHMQPVNKNNGYKLLNSLLPGNTSTNRCKSLFHKLHYTHQSDKRIYEELKGYVTYWCSKNMLIYQLFTFRQTVTAASNSEHVDLHTKLKITPKISLALKLKSVASFFDSASEICRMNCIIFCKCSIT